jgi:hypothetical protein
MNERQNIDHGTHEPKTASARRLTPQQILAKLSVVRGTQPVAALAAADLHRDALLEPLLQAIARGLDDPDGLSDADANLFAYAMYLLAKWREPRAHRLIVRWLSLPDEGASAIGGDMVTQDGGGFLASTCNGDLDAIKALIVNREANEYCRGQAVAALALLAAWGEVTYESVVDHFLWLVQEGLEREGSHAWDCLAAYCADLEAVRVFPDLRRAYEQGLIDPGFMQPDELDEVESAPRGRTLARFREHHPPISNVVHATSWWGCFSKQRTRRAQELAEAASRHGIERNAGRLDERVASGPGEHDQPHPGRLKIGRNDPCPCGSGKKYKKCCVS